MVDLPVIMFDVLAMIMECYIACLTEAIATVMDSTMVRRLLAMIVSSIVSAAGMDIEVVDTIGWGYL